VSANVDLVRSIITDWERGDFTRDGWAHPEIEFVTKDGPTPGRWTGTAGMAEGVLQLLTAWRGLRIYADEIRDLDDKRVLALTRLTGRGKTSGVDLGELKTSGAGVFHVQDRRVTKLVEYYDRDHALADLGLKE
jgi:hypothetical protein